MQNHATPWITLKFKHSQPFLTLIGLNLSDVLAPKAYPFLLVGILERLYTNSYTFFGSYILKKEEKEKKEKKKKHREGYSHQNRLNLECSYLNLLCKSCSLLTLLGQNHTNNYINNTGNFANVSRRIEWHFYGFQWIQSPELQRADLGIS